MRSRSAVLAPALFAVPWILALACGESAPPQAQAPIVVTPSTSAPVAEAAPDAASNASAAPVTSASASASAEPVASATVDAGASAASGRKVPSLRQGATQVTGKLPPEVIQRIVRQNFGRFRLCYEQGLKHNPALQGRVTAEFVIDRSGAVTTSKDKGSDLPDPNVVSCVVQSFGKLSFPQPEGGTVTVVYPVVFALTDAPPPRAASSGNMWGDAIGDAINGAGGLGIGDRAGGEGGGRGEGIGLGNIGTLGHGSSGKPVGTPSMRQGATTVNGRLPPEVIQRIVRQNFGRFRLCYENGLRTSPKLQGRVTVKFVIDTKGAVSDAKDGGSDLPDPGVVSCVVRGFGNLSFPQPEGGDVTVVYPLIFAPGETPAPAPSGSTKK